MAMKLQLVLSLLFLFLLSFEPVVVVGSRSFTIDYEKDTFMKDGQPFRYISGSMHYSRVPSYYWKDRLYKLRYAGLNAVQTYVPWNFHEPFPGIYNFEGDHDLVQFIKTAQEIGLLVILRAGPYICGEWEMGGFPSWLLRSEEIVLRSSNPVYLSYVDKWMNKLLPLVKPLLYENGGPIISVQVENEYGSYSTCDSAYMNHLETLFRNLLGPNVILFTTDGAGDGYLKCGATASLYTTVDFGATNNPEGYFQFQRKYQPHGPLVNSEFYTGWLDHWGAPHQRRDKSGIASSLDKILQLNASVNMYMFEGGTNFAFWNGANSGGSSYSPQPTSYDYDAPLTECGNMTDKYTALRDVIKNYLPLPSMSPPTQTPASKYGDDAGGVYLKQYVDLLSDDSDYMFTKQVVSQHPLTFEDMEQNYGFMLYTNVNEIDTQTTQVKLIIGQLHDRVCVYWNKKRVATVTRTSGAPGNLSVTFNVSANETKGHLSLLVENMGRVNYGSYIPDKKGILSDVYVNGVEVLQWKSSSLPLNNTEQLKFIDVGKVNPPSSAAFFKGNFTISGTPTDTYFQANAWSKGVAFINNFNIGRYWPAVGPQKTLYVPANILKEGLNEVVVFELDNSPVQQADIYGFIQFMLSPDLGPALISFVEAETRIK